MSAQRCHCGFSMTPEMGFSLHSPEVWLWWRCGGDEHHISPSVLLPHYLAAVAMSRIPGSDRSWNELPTTEPPGGTSRATVSAPSASSSEEPLASARG